jgi:ribonuclease HI
MERQLRSDVQHSRNAWPKVDIYTDGACIDNPGPGGWAAILQHVRANGERVEKELTGICPESTTNNAMELTAVLEGLQALNQPCRVTVHTDSKYIYNGMTRWLPGWKDRGWRKASGEQIRNPNLWKSLDEARHAHQVQWCWIKAHNKHPENERADRIAHAAAHEAEELARESVSPASQGGGES